jgi:hypothetical protein
MSFRLVMAQSGKVRRVIASSKYLVLFFMALNECHEGWALDLFAASPLKPIILKVENANDLLY